MRQNKSTIKYLMREPKKNKTNITLIGMAGVGKSCTARYLASATNLNCIEIDKLIYRRLEVLKISKNKIKDNVFKKIEEEVVLNLKNKNNSIFDTGGSVVYSHKAMKLLKSISKIFYLKDSPKKIEKRFNERGEMYLVGLSGKTFKQLLKERTSLYEKYANYIIDVSRYKNLQDVYKKILKLSCKS